MVAFLIGVALTVAICLIVVAFYFAQMWRGR